MVVTPGMSITPSMVVTPGMVSTAGMVVIRVGCCSGHNGKLNELISLLNDGAGSRE